MSMDQGTGGKEGKYCSWVAALCTVIQLAYLYRSTPGEQTHTFPSPPVQHSLHTNSDDKEQSASWPAATCLA